MTQNFLQSKFPEMETTIFSVMSALAKEHQAINLGQGFPDFACDPKLLDGVESSMRNGENQYPPMAGIPELRNKISEKIQDLYGKYYSPDDEITVTAGATQAILTVVLATIRPGEEVVVIEPVYDSYLPAINLAGGKAISVRMIPQKNAMGVVEKYVLPWNDLASAINPKTRLIMINSPHNPTGMVWQSEDLERLAELVKQTNALICSDEVYEHMVYDNQLHQSISRHAELCERSFVVSSFGKTFHVTGWKVGYVAAPKELMAEFRKVHQFNVFTVNTPMQYGLASYLNYPKAYKELPSFYQQKRDFFRASLSNTYFSLLPSDGTYFQCVDYSQLKIPEAKLGEIDFCKWLTAEVKVAAIPVSAFYSSVVNSNIIRFCYAKKDSTLVAALDQLKKIAS